MLIDEPESILLRQVGMGMAVHGYEGFPEQGLIHCNGMDTSSF